MTQQPAQEIPQQPVVQPAAQVNIPPNLSYTQGQLPNICANCKSLVLPGFAFCPKCGSSLDGTKSGISVGKQIYVYFMSALLPPSGLVWGIKYVLNPNPKTKIVGWVAIGITIITLLISYFAFIAVWQQIQQQLGNFQMLNNSGLPNQQLQQLQQIQNVQKSLSQ